MAPVGKTPSRSSERQKRQASKEPEEDVGGPWLNLWVGNLSPRTVDEDLMAIFTKYGAMDCITSYIPHTYAFVYFRTIEEAKVAKDALQGTVVRGKSIKIQFARPAQPGKTLWVGGISQSITKKQLEDEFMKFGKIEEYRFLRYRGSAFIGFHDIEDAIIAQKSMNWKLLGGGEIRVDFQRLPPTRRDLPVAREFRSNRKLVLDDTLLAPEQPKYVQESPHHAMKPYEGRRDVQSSNVLWVGYPPELQVDEKMLHNSMILFGEIEKIRSFPSKHYCYVQFRSVDEARRAKEGLQGCLFGDARMQILFYNNELGLGREIPLFNEQDKYFNESPVGPVDLFSGRSMGPNNFPGRIASKGVPRASISARPFTHRFDPHRVSYEYHDFDGSMHTDADGIVNNPKVSNWKRSSPTTLGVISPRPRHTEGEWDEFDMREAKRSRVDGISISDGAYFQGVDDDDMLYLPSLPSLDRALQNRRHQATEMHGHGTSQVYRGIDYYWRGTIAKGGRPVCCARCVPIGNGIEAHFPNVVNCSARTGLEMLTLHYTESVGFDMVYFLPDSEEDFASYTEFLRYLGQRDRAGVAKLDDGTTMFLVPPSEFLTKVLKFSGPERLYGVVLRMPHQKTIEQLEATVLPPDLVDVQPLQLSHRSYNYVGQNENQPLKGDNGCDSHDRSNPYASSGRRGLHSEESNSMAPIIEYHPKSHAAMPKAEVSLTPELIAALTSLIPTSNPSVALSNVTLASSSGMSTLPCPQINDNSMTVQGRWGQEARATFSAVSVEQMSYTTQNTASSGHQYTCQALSGHQYASQAPLVAQFPSCAIPNGVDSSFRPSLGGLQRQESTLSMQPGNGNMGTVGSMVLPHLGQYTALQNDQPSDVGQYVQFSQYLSTSMGNTGNLQQIPISTLPMNNKVNNMAQPWQTDTSGSIQDSLDGDADKDQRYQSTLQFAASLLLQIQQQQQAKGRAGLGSGTSQ
ncbi:hypothetical protein HPP92_026203 [Vanilla planifolia]|uniref:Flowering time control protein FPA n=1 Tax=Vanilla planifolia TaxID=51239 RepID=A0A835U868_VANPL|nr:hypothetical protein HPP92_026203 [Vanilla planifolia]